jgi:dCMP deaminase
MRPSRIDTLLEVAAVIAKRSTCNRLQVGAVVARDGRILTTGYNGPPSGMDHCEHEEFETQCNLAVHAEANAIAFAARYGFSTDGAEMFLTDSPCHNCAKLIINAGIVRVYYSREYRLTHGTDLLEDAEVETYCAGAPDGTAVTARRP